jgi:hypothetical protein
MLDFYIVNSLKQQSTGSDVGKIQHLNLSTVVSVNYRYKNPTSEPVDCCFSELSL